jgi:hypothetical protein
MFFPPQTQSGISQGVDAHRREARGRHPVLPRGVAGGGLHAADLPAGDAGDLFPADHRPDRALAGVDGVGLRAGQGIGVAFGNGIRCSVQIAFFGILLFALRTMFMRSANLRYSAPWEAVTATFDLFHRVLHAVPDHPRLGHALDRRRALRLGGRSGRQVVAIG